MPSASCVFLTFTLREAILGGQILRTGPPSTSNTHTQGLFPRKVSTSTCWPGAASPSRSPWIMGLQRNAT